MLQKAQSQDVHCILKQIPFLMTYEKKYPGMKPLRTYSGPRYVGGVSDHFPIILCIFGSY